VEITLSDGRPNDKKEQRKPTWTERLAPETVRPGATRPLATHELSEMVPAADPVVRSAYARTGSMPDRPSLAQGRNDALTIQKGTRLTRVLSFEVEGVHWKAGFAPDIRQTPLGQYVPVEIPPENEVLSGNGFVLRPVENDLESVLRELMPAKLLAAGEAIFGPRHDLSHIYLYYIPQAKGATIGILAWYLAAVHAKAHMIYLQTDIKQGDVRVLHEMHKTFRASLIAKGPAGSKSQPFEFWRELHLASTELEATFKGSTLAKNSAAMRSAVSTARQTAESGLYQGLIAGFAELGKLMRFIFIKAPQMLLVGLILGISRLLGGLVKIIDGLAAPKPPQN
jgi:hypothetical protein